MSAPINVVSSKATQALLAELTREFMMRTGVEVSLESVGGVHAADRVRAGAVFDVVVLADHVIDELIRAKHLLADSKKQLVYSGLAVAVRHGAPHPDLGTEDSVRLAILGASSIGCSTGPSGVEVIRLLERWGIADHVSERIVVAPPGVPVGALVAGGQVELGFQQRSELLHIKGVDIVGPLPSQIQIVTTFSAAVGARSPQPESAEALISFLSLPATADAKRRQGMEPAPHRSAE